MTPNYDPEEFKDLPVMTAKQVSKYYRPWDKLDDVPARYLMETDDFLMHFNTRETPYPPAEPLTRSTLQFYSSPRIRLLPLPIYRNRHTAHYIVPDHFARLAVICVLRDTFFMPIKLIQKLIEAMPGDNYRFLEKWPGTARDLLQAAPLLKNGFQEEDLIRFAAIKTLIFRDNTPEAYRNTVESFILDQEEHLKDFFHKQIEKQGRRLQEWMVTGPGVTYVRELAKTLSGANTPQEYVEKVRGSKRFAEKAAKERAEKPRMHPR